MALGLLCTQVSQVMLRIFRHYVSGLVFVLFLGDLAVVLGALYLTELSAPWAGYAPFSARFIEVGVVVAFILYLGDLYQLRQASRLEFIARILICQSAAALVLATIGFAIPALRLGRSAFIGTSLLYTSPIPRDA
jgi:hypothetical protein